MALTVGINGFGRIGRQVYKAIRDYYDDKIDVVAVNDIGNIEIMTHLLKYDTNYGRFPGDVTPTEDGFIANGDKVTVLAERDPARLPWGKLGVEVVVESTGLFRARAKAQAHLDAGAKKVIITAPGKDEDLTIVLGVNEKMYNPARHHILSNASCTTNGLAPEPSTQEVIFMGRVTQLVFLAERLDRTRFIGISLCAARARECDHAETYIAPFPQIRAAGEITYRERMRGVNR
jgi:glyceraldehyde-3-phosphate dehydrogenase type I